MLDCIISCSYQKLAQQDAALYQLLIGILLFVTHKPHLDLPGADTDARYTAANHVLKLSARDPQKNMQVRYVMLHVDPQINQAPLKLVQAMASLHLPKAHMAKICVGTLNSRMYPVVTA